LKTIRSRVTYANVMSTLAVFLVLGGGAMAAVKLGKNSVGTKQLKVNAVTSAKIKDGAVTGSKVDLSTLGAVPNATDAVNAKTADSAKTAETAKTATTATTATNATNATNAVNATKAQSATTAENATNATNAATASNALSLGGIPASEYTQSSCSAINGAVKGFARIDIAAVSKTEISTAGVSVPYNCSGDEIRVGNFLKAAFVEFVGSPVAMAFVTPLGIGPTTASVEEEGNGKFLVALRNGSGELVEGSFNIMTP
jgi:cytoskeletal protein RodZ